jgi:hypothetical protein
MIDRNAVGLLLSRLGESLATEEDSSFRALLVRHFACDPGTLPTVSEDLAPADLPNLQVALEAWLGGPGRAYTVRGVTTSVRYHRPSLATLMSTHAAQDGAFTAGPVSYRSVPLHGGETLSCAQNALYLVRDNGAPFALLVLHSDEGYRTSLSVEVLAPGRGAGEKLLAELRSTMRSRSVYRGRVVSLGLSPDRTLTVEFHHLPSIERAHVILPEDVLARVERQSFAFSRHREVLKRSGRHLKRGMLLHGPPGTGKTFTAMYLAAQMKDRTVLLVTGREQGLIGPVCKMARLLQPSTIILEDVDLIAEDRRTADACSAPVLFELLNEMDGLREDADVLFILTTNRPEALEPALAARPGRVDLAVEVPLPDADCRRRLITLYARGITLALTDPDALVGRTEGVSAAFLKELLRRAALVAADAGSADVVRDEHMEDALRELLSDRDRLTRALLGASNARAALG